MGPHHHDHGGHRWQEVFGPISILTVPTYAARKKVMDACSRAVVRYWHEVEGEARHEKDEGDEKNSGDGEKSNAAQQDTPGRASDDPPKDNTMGDEGKDSQPSQKVWEIKTWNWNLFLCLTEDQPGLCGRSSPEPVPHKGGPELQRGRGERDRELGGPLQVRVMLGALLHRRLTGPPGPAVLPRPPAS